MDSALDSRQEPKRCKHNTEALDHEATTTRARANEEQRMCAPSNRSRPVRARSSRAGRRRRGSAKLNRGGARQGRARINPGRRRANRWRPRSNGEDEGEVAAARSCAQPRVLGGGGGVQQEEVVLVRRRLVPCAARLYFQRAVSVSRAIDPCLCLCPPMTRKTHTTQQRPRRAYP